MPTKRRSRSKVRIHLERGTLSPFGYRAHSKTKTRRASLKKAMKKHPSLRIARKLNALATMNKNTHPTLSRIYKSDFKWVRRTSKK